MNAMNIANDIKVTASSIHSADAAQLIEELSATLESITGDSGKKSFNLDDVCVERACFAIARDGEGRALGCGAFRPMDAEVAEVKRMYSRPGTRGVGTQVLLFLEQRARELGFLRLQLETRVVNQRALRFYEQRGYLRIANYGQYVGNDKAACFEKVL